MPLTDLNTVKRYLSLGTTASDFKLGLLIPDQSQTFLDETGRTSFDLETYTEVRDGLGVDTMQLLNFPVQSLTSFTKNGVAVPLSTGYNVPGYQLDTPLGKITLICDTFSCGPGITFDRKNVTVVYIAGYPTITVTNELQTIPATAGAGNPNPNATWPAAYTICVQLPNWQSDGGVSYFGSTALTPVTGPPGVGQYYVVGGGTYLFNVADAGKQVTISYVAAGYPSDVVGAVTRMVALRYYQQGHEDKKQDKQGDGTTTYSKEAYPTDVLRVIKKYKRYFSLPGF
jgi:hypothetical protein